MLSVHTANSRQTVFYKAVLYLSTAISAHIAYFLSFTLTLLQAIVSPDPPAPLSIPYLHDLQQSLPNTFSLLKKQKKTALNLRWMNCTQVKAARLVTPPIYQPGSLVLGLTLGSMCFSQEGVLLVAFGDDKNWQRSIVLALFFLSPSQIFSVTFKNWTIFIMKLYKVLLLLSIWGGDFKFSGCNYEIRVLSIFSEFFACLHHQWIYEIGTIFSTFLFPSKFQCK